MIMKKTMFILAVLLANTCYANEYSLVADLKQLYTLQREEKPESMSQEERWAQFATIRDRARPIVAQEFAKLLNGEVSTTARELLSYPETIGFSLGVLHQQFQTCPAEKQDDLLDTIFTTTPDSLRRNIVFSFVVELPASAFSGKVIQDWLVAKINAGLPAGAFYFILTDESAGAVAETAKSSMKRFSKSKGVKDENLFSLLSASFLASRGDKSAINLLDSLLEKLELDSLLDTAYVIQAAAMSRNEKLTQKVVSIITSDKRSKSNGSDVVPQELSFAQIAASSCSLVIEGFPSIGYWGDYDEAVKKDVQEWLEANKKYRIKQDSARLFFKSSPVESIIRSMSRRWK